MGEKRVDWTSDVIQRLLEERRRGKSLKDLQALLFSMQGVTVTVARISQVLKQQQQGTPLDADRNSED